MLLSTTSLLLLVKTCTLWALKVPEDFWSGCWVTQSVESVEFWIWLWTFTGTLRSVKPEKRSKSEMTWSGRRRRERQSFSVGHQAKSILRFECKKATTKASFGAKSKIPKTTITGYHWRKTECTRCRCSSATLLPKLTSASLHYETLWMVVRYEHIGKVSPFRLASEGRRFHDMVF